MAVEKIQTNTRRKTYYEPVCLFLSEYIGSLNVGSWCPCVGVDVDGHVKRVSDGDGRED